MTKYLFIVAAVLTLVVGCKDGDVSESDTDQYSADAECPGGTAYNDCGLRGVCSGDPFHISQCVGDGRRYCGAPTNPCWVGSEDFWESCTQTGSRCFSTGERGCGGVCLPLSDFVPTGSFEGKWRERGNIVCFSDQELGPVQNKIEMLSFETANKFSVRWKDDDIIYMGHYENSEVKGQLTTRLTLDAPYAITDICDYLYTQEIDSLSLRLTNNPGGSCLFYKGNSSVGYTDYCGHIFERITDEQPDDDALLTDS